MNKVLYWLSARPLFALIGKGYAALRKALDNIPGFEAFNRLATLVTDRIFTWVRFPDAMESRFEPYIEFQRGRQMDRALVFALLVYMALLGAYPSNLGHLDTAPQIWIALPIVSGFNPYLGLVSGLVFSVADWIGKFLPFESVYGADFGGGFQNFWGARIGYILAYTTMILNGMLPGVLARVFRQFVRGTAHKILPRKATQAAMGVLMLVVAGALLYQIGGPRALYAMSAFSLMGFAMAMGPPPGQGSPCLGCGAMLPPGQYQCMACGGLSQEGQQYMEHKRQMEEQARQHAQQHSRQTPGGQPPGSGPPPPAGGPMPPGAGMPPVGAGTGVGGDYLYEALATVGSMLGATVGIVASYEWAQQVGNYGAFYALRAEPDVSCRDLSAGNYGELQAQSPVPGAVGGAMPPGAAGAMAPGSTGLRPTEIPDGEYEDGEQWSEYRDHGDGRHVRTGFIYDQSAGGWRTVQPGDVSRHGEVFDPVQGWMSSGAAAAEAATRSGQEAWRQQQWDNVRTGNTAHDRSMREMQERHEQNREMHQRRIEGNYSYKKFMYETNREILTGRAQMHSKAADRWDRRLKQAKFVKAGADIAMNALGSIPGPPAAISKAYTVASSGASGAAEAHVRGDSVLVGAAKGTAQGAATVVVQDAIGGAIGGAGRGMSGGKGLTGKMGGALRGGLTGAKRGAARSLNSARRGYRAVKSGLQAGTSTFRAGSQIAGRGMGQGMSAVSRGASGALKQGAHGGTVSAVGNAFTKGATRGGINQAGSTVGKGLTTMGRGAGRSLQGVVQKTGEAMGKTKAFDPVSALNSIFSGDRASAITGGNPVSMPDIASTDAAEGLQAITEEVGMG